jgi:hypothetical protein
MLVVVAVAITQAQMVVQVVVVEEQVALLYLQEQMLPTEVPTSAQVAVAAVTVVVEV